MRRGGGTHGMRRSSSFKIEFLTIGGEGMGGGGRVAGAGGRIEGCWGVRIGGG